MNRSIHVRSRWLATLALLTVATACGATHEEELPGSEEGRNSVRAEGDKAAAAVDRAAPAAGAEKPVPPPAPAGTCVDGALGGPTSCKPEEIWNKYVHEACASQGLTLVKRSVEEPCGEGQFRKAVYACCPKAEVPAEPKPAPVCSESVLGGPTSCKPEEIWNKYAHEACATAGQVLTKRAFLESCGDGSYRRIAFSCCPASAAPAPTPPAPAPAACVERTQGGPTSCKSDADWNGYAHEDCADEGLTVVKRAFLEPCAEGRYRKVAYTCCAKTPIK